jgi:hypothetical protein
LHGKYPSFVLVDEGREWWNLPIMQFMADKGVKLFSSRSGVHGAHVERAIRVLRDKLGRYQTDKDTKDFIGIWPTLIRNYNNTKNKTTGFKPSEVTEENQDQVFLNAYSRIIGAKNKAPSLRVGDLVRIAADKISIFSKSSEQSYTSEIFKASLIFSKRNLSTPCNFQCIFLLIAGFKSSPFDSCEFFLSR